MNLVAPKSSRQLIELSVSEKSPLYALTRVGEIRRVGSATSVKAYPGKTINQKAIGDEALRHLETLLRKR